MACSVLVFVLVLVFVFVFVFVIIQVAVSNQMQQTAATTAGPHQLATPRVGFHH